jgi:mono/diheme cytochrome c family protein
LGERLNGIQEVSGSIPLSSTISPSFRLKIRRVLASMMRHGYPGVMTPFDAIVAAAHGRPYWPFAWRVSLDALADEDLRQEILDALRNLIIAAGLVALGTWNRWARWPAFAIAAGIAWAAMPHLALLAVPAVPTVYWKSTTGFTPASIAAGAQAYAAHCASCHGEQGRGDGPAAAGMSIPPADLTAVHLWEHTEGELFWWISEGLFGPDGARVMPGIADQLDEATRWAVIDFLHANNQYGSIQNGVHHQH